MKHSIKYNEVAITPTLFFEDYFVNELISKIKSPDNYAYISDDIYELCTNIFLNDRENQERVWGNQIESFARQMISNCAVKIHIPTLKRNNLPSISKVKKLFGKSMGKRVSFVDRHNSVWLSVSKYLNPIKEAINHKYKKKNNNAYKFIDSLNIIAWGLYLLIIASRKKIEVVLNPKSVINSLDILLQSKLLGAEARSRLSNLYGIYRLYDNLQKIPGFSFVSDSRNLSIKERLEEIIEDAYLLEASYLRRLLSLKANIVSIKKELRLLTKYIVSNRKWAKGILSVSSVNGFIPYAKDIRDIINLINESSQPSFSPLCIHPNAHLSTILQNYNECAVQVKYNMYYNNYINYNMYWGKSI